MEQPPVIAPPPKRRRIRNLFYVLLPLLAAAFAIKVILFGFYQPKRPTDRELLQHFQKNRAAFGQLRDMFRADDNLKLRRVGDQGIRTLKPFFEGKPTPTSDFSLERYQKYLRLLHQVSSPVAFRLDHDPGNPCIAIWEAGWFAHWKHITLSWVDEVPTNTVTSLDQCHIPPWAGERQLFYRYIDENWYFVTDMRPF